MNRLIPTSLIRYCIVLLAAVVINTVLIILLGEKPIRIFSLFFIGAFGTWGDVCWTLFYATPLIFTGIAVAVGLYAGLFNIGAEGQLYIGALACAFFGMVFGNWPGVIALPLIICMALISGGLWGWIPGYFKAKTGAHEVITTIMLNFIALGLVGYCVSGPLHNPGDSIPQTVPVGPGAHLPALQTLLNFLGPDLRIAAPINVSLLLAVISLIAMYYFLWRTIPGFELRTIGSNPDAAKVAGISLIRISGLALALGGAAAALAGVNEVLGFRHQLLGSFSGGLGFTGIAVALMGRNHPVGIFVSAVFFGALIQGGLVVDIFSDTISKDMVYVIQGVVILCVVAEQFFDRFTLTDKSWKIS